MEIRCQSSVWPDPSSKVARLSKNGPKYPPPPARSPSYNDMSHNTKDSEILLHIHSWIHNILADVFSLGFDHGRVQYGYIVLYESS